MIQIHDFPETMGGSHGFQDTLRLTPEAWLRIFGDRTLGSRNLVTSHPRIVFWRTKMSFPTVFDDSNYWADLFLRSIHVSIQNFEVLDEQIHKMRPLSFAVPLTSPVSRKHGVTMKICPVKINSSARFLFWVTFIWHCVYHFPKDFNVSSFFTSSFLHLFSNLFQLFSTHT